MKHRFDPDEVEWPYFVVRMKCQGHEVRDGIEYCDDSRDRCRMVVRHGDLAFLFIGAPCWSICWLRDNIDEILSDYYDTGIVHYQRVEHRCLAPQQMQTAAYMWPSHRHYWEHQCDPRYCWACGASSDRDLTAIADLWRAARAYCYARLKRPMPQIAGGPSCVGCGMRRCDVASILTAELSLAHCFAAGCRHCGGEIRGLDWLKAELICVCRKCGAEALAAVRQWILGEIQEGRELACLKQTSKLLADSRKALRKNDLGALQSLREAFEQAASSRR